MTARFEFGKNWQDYLRKNFSEERVAIACTSLQKMLGLSSLEGLSFLDIGCGSGLSSLAALRLGAARIVSIDYDSNSVAATQQLHAYATTHTHTHTHGRVGGAAGRRIRRIADAGTRHL